MRTKIIFLSLYLCFLSAIMPLRGQEILLEENFNQCELPANWTVNVNGSGPATWNVGFPLNTNSDSSSIDGTCMLIIDDDAAGDNTPPYILDFVTPVFDATQYSTIEMSVDVHFRNVDGSSSFTILAYDGTDYHELTKYQGNRNTGTQFSEFETFTADLSFHASSTMSIVFRYDDGNIWAWWAGIDNLKVTGSGKGTNIILQNFNDCNLPSGWTTEIVRGVDDWQFGYINNGNTGSTSMNGSCFAYFDDDGIGDTAAFSTVRLYSPQFDGTQFANYFLDIDLIFRRAVDLENFAIYVNDGNEFKLVRSYFEDFNGPHFDIYGKERIDISTFRSEQMQIVFQYEDGNDWGWWVGLDNMKISGEGETNDLCTNAIDLIVNEPCTMGDNRTALFLGSPSACGSKSVGAMWYKFTAPNTAVLQITNESNFNDVLSVFTGNCGSLATVDCTNRDEHGFDGEYFYIDAQAGQDYFLRLNGEDADFGRSRGTFCLAINEVNSRPDQPANDDCTDAIALSIGTDCINGDNLYAEFDGPEPSLNGKARADIWYHFTAVGPQELEITSAANFSDVITLYEGSCGSLSEIACNEYGQALKIKDLQANQQYFIQLSGNFATIEGNVCMAVKEVPPTTVENDDCLGALTVAVDGSCVSASNFGASFEGPEPGCEIFPNSNIWFRFTAPASGGVKINTGASFVHTLALYKGNCNDLQEESCHENPLYCNGYFSINGLSPGDDYWIQIASALNTFGYLDGEVCLHLLDLNSKADFDPLALSTKINCLGDGRATLDITISGGNGPYEREGNTDMDTLMTGDSFLVIVRDEKGCELSESGTIDCGEIACTLQLALTKSNISCFGAEDGQLGISTNSGEGPYTYNWSNGATTADLTNLMPGNYNVTVMDANGCQGSLNLNISEPALLLANAVATGETGVGASDGMAMASPIGGTAPFSYLWSNTATSATISGLLAGTYTVTVTDARGCTSEESVVVSSFSCAGVEVDLMAEDVLCFGQGNGTATASPIAGEGPYTFQWSNGVVGATVGMLAVGQYSVSMTDANGCLVIESFVIEEPELLTMQAVEENGRDCDGNYIGQITVEAQGGTSPYSYTWRDGSMGASNAGLAIGNNRVTVTDANNCTEELEFSITTPNTLSAETTAEDVNCFGGSTGSITVDAFSDHPPYTFQWSDPAFPPLPNISNLSAGTYTVTITDGIGCTIASSITVDQPIMIEMTMAVIDETASNQSGMINVTVVGGTAPYTYTWYLNGQLFSNDEDLSDLSAGEYELVVTDANNCTLNSGIIIVDNLVGTNDPELAAKVRLLPNPTSGKFRVEVALDQVMRVRLLVYDIAGKLILESPASAVKERHYAFDLSNHPAGVYPVRVWLDDRMVIKQVVVSR